MPLARKTWFSFCISGTWKAVNGGYLTGSH